MIKVEYDLPEFCKNCIYNEPIPKLDTVKEEDENYGNYSVSYSVSYSCTYAEMCGYLHAKWEKEKYNNKEKL